MNINKTNTEQTQQKQSRLWPGVVIVTIQWLLRFGMPLFVSGDTITQIAIFAGLLGGLAIIIWWAFFSRVPQFERWGAIVLMIISLIATSHILHESIQTAMMGLMFTIYAIPVMSLAFVIAVVARSRLSDRPRRIALVATILVTSGFWACIRTDGMDGSAHHDFAWRWAKTAEEKLLAHAEEKVIKMPLNSTVMEKKAEWPGFRGQNRDGIIQGVKIKTDWSSSPPVELWRRPIGPGCSSFAVHGNLFYTQEQRGNFEMVTCYHLNSGEPVWSHGDSTRFWDSHAGAGPRSTPTLYGEQVYTLGATGILNALNPIDGSVIWSRNAASDSGVKVLTWGFTGSPLVGDGLVIISLSGKLAAYNAINGNPLWSCTDGGNSFSSPHQVTIDGVTQVILTSQSGALSVEPNEGKQLWKYDWQITDRILQPAVINGGDLLLAGEGSGLRRIKVSHAQDGWSVKELWSSTEMMLNFNDFIIHKGFAYGFDGPSIACIDIKDGKRKWKGDPYRGWILLLADQDLLLVLSEKGKLALVEATPNQFNELALIPAIKGKTWNHPVLVGDILLVRNSQEMAAFRLSLIQD